ncbi:uncharacterized protein LOC125940734 isoform X2 [Dermacentor silvarum]|uniref:uncharacterized protein LOC125940734 isoform X1 n=1 Tax=Dermacentor silvarum TaxID=543639 RepID=UPI0021016CD5|nr:uncharacterized protein LOC125940734 isoform X1 [Dermacentor silvarum]XP_049513167.1 uncharacterized protein LOC125940734 isoform X2 [Dermacentor silvarum]
MVLACLMCCQLDSSCRCSQCLCSSETLPEKCGDFKECKCLPIKPPCTVLVKMTAGITAEAKAGVATASRDVLPDIMPLIFTLQTLDEESAVAAMVTATVPSFSIDNIVAVGLCVPLAVPLVPKRAWSWFQPQAACLQLYGRVAISLRLLRCIFFMEGVPLIPHALSQMGKKRSLLRVHSFLKKN